jgi:YbbR domain-containing protein
MRKMRTRLLNNWGLKLISLVLAFLLWFLVIQIGDPKDDRDIGTIQVKLVNTELLDKANKVYEVLDNTDTVRVSVYAPMSVFTQLRSSDITAEADVSKLTDINTIPITFTSSNANVVSIRGSHDSVKLNVEDKVSKYVSLISSTEGEVADGYMVSALTPDQNRIEVSGPRSVVEQVKYAGAKIDVTDATSNLTANVDIQLYDEDNSEVEHANLVKNVDYVRMSVEVLAVKTVPVELEASGVPEKGYMATGVVEIDPAYVQIAGSSYTLSAISSIAVPAEQLDLTGATGDVVNVIDIREYLPENVKLADSNFSGKVTATAYVEPIEEITLQIPIQNVTVTNLPEGFEAEISDSAETVLSLELSGLKDQIDPLRQESLSGVADVSGWMENQGMAKLRAGAFNIPVTFRLDDSIAIHNPPTVRVIIKEADE